MIARANTKISILRGEKIDEFGDASPAEVKIAEGVPAFLNEGLKRVFTYDDPAPRMIRYNTCRVDPRTDILENDMIIDERTGTRYMVDSFVGNTENPGMQMDVRMDLKVVGDV